LILSLAKSKFLSLPDHPVRHRPLPAHRDCRQLYGPGEKTAGKQRLLGLYFIANPFFPALQTI